MYLKRSQSLQNVISGPVVSDSDAKLLLIFKNVRVAGVSLCI
uniref:Uncharacterized protein n=1 Tax=Anguilla anguilla TaxID=7936 RepID=A0A0E9WD95_ANGAN